MFLIDFSFNFIGGKINKLNLKTSNNEKKRLKYNEALKLVNRYKLNKNLKKYKKKQLDLQKLNSSDFDLI